MFQYKQYKNSAKKSASSNVTIIRTSQNRTEWRNQHTALNSMVTHQTIIWYLYWC